MSLSLLRRLPAPWTALLAVLLMTKPLAAFGGRPYIDVASCLQSGGPEVDHRQRVLDFARLHGAQAANKYLAAMRHVARVQPTADGRAVLLEGRIDASTPAALARHLDLLKQLKRLEINSLGGDVSAAVDLALVLKDLDLTLVVDGYCMSSCANFILPASRRLVLRGGLVGFHGGARACLEALGLVDGVRRLGSGRYLELVLAARKEDRLLAGTPKVGALIALSQRPDRGAMDGQPREWLLVHPRHVQELGVTEVELASTALFEHVVAAGEASLIGRSHVWEGFGKAVPAAPR